MAEVVQTEIQEPGPSADALPILLQAGIVAGACRGREDKIRPRLPRGSCQQFQCRRGERNDLGPGFTVGEAEALPPGVHPIPSQSQDLGFSTAGEEKESHRSGC